MSRAARDSRAQRPPGPSPGDAAAIEVLLEAAAAASGRAPAVASRWLDGALRLLGDGDRECQISLRVALAAALRSIGELERCREVLLETIELVGEDDEPQQLELTAWCAAVEHGLGVTKMLTSASCVPERGSTTMAPPRARRCRSSWRSTASTRSISSRRWRWALERWRTRGHWPRRR
jgi:hypothetical protein